MTKVPVWLVAEQFEHGQKGTDTGLGDALQVLDCVFHPVGGYDTLILQESFGAVDPVSGLNCIWGIEEGLVMHHAFHPVRRLPMVVQAVDQLECQAIDQAKRGIDQDTQLPSRWSRGFAGNGLGCLPRMNRP